jgi:prepilin-type N-terminal cleavage/methylation domain-containing protein/prepilin-type processing-associated H-X9-DG protein
MRRARRGFTLIELLVVIAIIAILAAILFPIFVRAKENSRIATCSSNLRQIHTGLTLYLDSYNGFMPPSRPINFYIAFEHPGQQIGLDSNRADLPDSPRFQIHFLLAPYVSGKAATTQTPYDSFRVFHCPTDNITPMLDGDGNFDKGSDPDSSAGRRWELCNYPKYGSSYQWRLGQETPQYSGNTSPDGAQGTDLLSSRCISAIRNPSQVGAARDAQTWHIFSRTHTRADWRDPHAGGNVLYLDGHVKLIMGQGEFTAGIY